MTEDQCVYFVCQNGKILLTTINYKEYCNYLDTDWSDSDDEDSSENRRKSRIVVVTADDKKMVLESFRLTAEANHIWDEVVKSNPSANFDQISEEIDTLGIKKYADYPELAPLRELLNSGGSVAFEYIDRNFYGIAIGNISTFIEKDIIQAEKDVKCTYNVTGRNFVYQDWYSCSTCFAKDSGIALCKACADVCHKGHDLIYHKARSVPNLWAFCDCGAGDTPISCSVCK